MQVARYIGDPATWHQREEVPCHLERHQQTGRSRLVWYAHMSLQIWCHSLLTQWHLAVAECAAGPRWWHDPVAALALQTVEANDHISLNKFLLHNELSDIILQPFKFFWANVFFFSQAEWFSIQNNLLINVVFGDIKLIHMRENSSLIQSVYSTCILYDNDCMIICLSSDGDTGSLKFLQILPKVF